MGSMDPADLISGMQAAANPDRGWEWISPKLVMYEGVKAAFQPKPNSSMVRFVAAKKICIAANHCHRLH